MKLANLVTAKKLLTSKYFLTAHIHYTYLIIFKNIFLINKYFKDLLLKNSTFVASPDKVADRCFTK